MILTKICPGDFLHVHSTSNIIKYPLENYHSNFGKIGNLPLTLQQRISSFVSFTILCCRKGAYLNCFNMLYLNNNGIFDSIVEMLVTVPIHLYGLYNSSMLQY